MIETGVIETVALSLPRSFNVSASVALNLAGSAGLEERAHALLAISLEMTSGVTEAELQQLIEKETGRPFDLSEGQLFRARLFQLGPDRFVLLLVAHKVAADRGSLLMLLEDLLRGSSHSFVDGDFVRARDEWTVSEAGRLAIDFWRQQHENKTQVFEWHAGQPSRAATMPIVLAADLPSRLQSLAETEGCSVDEILLAGLASTLQRHSTEQEVLIGLVDEAWRAEYPRTIGWLENLLPLRLDFAGNPTFRQLLRQVHISVAAARQFGKLPFEKAIEAIPLERRPGRRPLVQVAFRADSTLDWIEFHSTGDSGLDLVFSIATNTTGLRIRIECAASIGGLAEHFAILLQGATATPDCPVSQLPILSEPERDQLLREWNSTACEYPDSSCVHELFEQQVARTPQSVAAAFGNSKLTYAELNSRANRLAHYLVLKGVGPEVCVGIALERSLEMLVAILAVLKAGGAYVPLDPTYPRGRLAFMATDSQLPLVLTQEALKGNLPLGDIALISLEDIAVDVASQPDTNLTGRAAVSNLAYVIYTSGSTGRPKGVQVTHLGIGNMALAQARVFGLRPDDVVLQFASINFDASVSEIFKTLLTGACLCLASSENLLPGDPLIATLRRHAISVVTLPPSLLSVLNPQKMPQVRVLISAGEACSAELVERWHSGRRLFNAYGPTETTVCATIGECRPAEGAAPIGRPIANTRIYILNPDLQLVPAGVPGEIHIGAPGLARGYANQPELTAEKFIADPFLPGSRLYKTGDLGVYRPDGNIQFLGRIDHQVKIRGYRIEQGEIEAVLQKHPAVGQAFVMVREDRPGEKKLVAYIAPRTPGLAINIEQLRAHALEYLPDYMIPAAFVLVEAFPLSPSGKVDQRALPAPGRERPELAQEYGEPQTPLEQSIAAIWGEILGLDSVGREDNFFEIGGDSLIATLVLARLAREFEIDLPLSMLFEAPTVAGLVEAIMALAAGSGSTANEEVDGLLTEIEAESPV